MSDDDDEEIILQSSELDKYMKICNFDNLNCSNGNEKSESYFAHPKKSAVKNVQNKTEDAYASQLCYSYQYPELCDYSTNMIYIIIKSGLLYPEHVMDVEKYFTLKNICPKKLMSKFNLIFHSSFFIGITSAITLVPKKSKIFGYLSVLVTSVFYSYKIYTIKKMHSEIKMIKNFVYVIDHLFFVTKRTLSFILDCEFIFRSKASKGYSFYTPNNGFISNACKELKYSSLLLPELRKMLSDIFLDLAVTFCGLSRFMKTELPLKSVINCDDYIELSEDFASQYSSMDPSIELLKKLNNIYLLSQSECLRRLIFSFIQDFWSIGYSNHNLKNVIIEVTSHMNKFNLYAINLESCYLKCLKSSEGCDTEIVRNTALKIKNNCDQLLIYIRNFLTKADAHLLSMSLDLRYLNNWINEYDDCYVENSTNHEKTLKLFLDKLILMKGNVECIASFYNDNCNILESMLNKKSSVNAIDPLSSDDSDLPVDVKQTGIEVGKSDFTVNCQDEVLISLSNFNDLDDSKNDLLDDYEDEKVNKCLPKNVLNELKYALQSKKEEWIEREKKALSSKIDIDELELDTLGLLNTSGSATTKFILNKENVCKKRNKKLKNCNSYADSESEFSDEEETNAQRLSKKHVNEGESISKTESVFVSPFNTVEFIRNNDHGNSSNCSEGNYLAFNENNSENENVTISSNTPSTENVYKSSHFSFLDQIKSAQKSFNVIMKEEEFIDEISNE